MRGIGSRFHFEATRECKTFSLGVEKGFKVNGVLKQATHEEVVVEFELFSFDPLYGLRVSFEVIFIL